MKRDILSVLDMKDDLEDLIDLSIRLKQERYKRVESLDNRVLALIFEKPSTRTRVSFETAMDQLGGHSIYLNPNDMQMGRGETIHDTAKVLSGFVDAIAYRAFSHENVTELARNSSIPVINALDDMEHPVQIIADFMTVKEERGKLSGINFTYVGDGNNVANSLLLGAAILGVNITISCPEGYEPKEEFVKKSREIASSTGSEVKISHNPPEDVKDADVIYTDVWVSMGEENERAKREEALKNFQVNEKLVANARDDFIFLHCLPAHRGSEVSAGVIDGPRSRVFQQAENRLHTEKAVLVKLVKD